MPFEAVFCNIMSYVMTTVFVLALVSFVVFVVYEIVTDIKDRRDEK